MTLVIGLFAGGCATHQPSDPIAIVFGQPISYAAVESEPVVTAAGSLRAITVSPSGETLRERARRCGWWDQDVSLYRFRQLFLTFFTQGYRDKIGSDISRDAVRPHPSRMPARGSGVSASRFILIEDPTDPKIARIVPRPDPSYWWVTKTLYAKEGGRVSKRHGWLPIDALQKEISRLEISGEIRFVASDYRERLWHYFNNLKDEEFATQAEVNEHFRAPWWEKPLPDDLRKRVRVSELGSSPAQTVCTPP